MDLNIFQNMLYNDISCEASNHLSEAAFDTTFCGRFQSQTRSKQGFCYGHGSWIIHQRLPETLIFKTKSGSRQGFSTNALAIEMFLRSVFRSCFSGLSFGTLFCRCLLGSVPMSFTSVFRRRRPSALTAVNGCLGGKILQTNSLKPRFLTRNTSRKTFLDKGGKTRMSNENSFSRRGFLSGATLRHECVSKRAQRKQFLHKARLKQRLPQRSSAQVKSLDFCKADIETSLLLQQMPFQDRRFQKKR